jgi:hypothetical protein
MMDLDLALTEKGLMTNSLFRSPLDRFLEISKSQFPDLENLRVLDRLGAHLQAGLVPLGFRQRLYHL